MNSGFFKFFFILVLAIIIGSIGYRLVMVSNAHSSGKHVYEITVQNYKQNESYMCSEFTKDSTGCLLFKDEFGIKHTVCSNYTISEW